MGKYFHLVPTRNPISWMLTVFLVVMFARRCRSEDSAGELAKIVSQLQFQVLGLQRDRDQDQKTIHVLQEKLHRHFESMDDSEVESKTNSPTSFSWTTTTTPHYDSERTKSFMKSTLEMQKAPESFNHGGIETATVPPQYDGMAKSSSGNHFARTGESDEDMSQNGRRDSFSTLQRERQSISLLELQLRRLKLDLQEIVKIKEKEATVTDEIAEFRLEADSLREELRRVKRELESLRSQQEDTAQRTKQAKDGHVTTRWMQKSVADLRHELSELARSVNTSQAIGQKHNVDANLQLVRSDISDLRHRLNGVHVDQERDSAWVAQLKEDLAELRTKTQQVTAFNIRLSQEVDALKEEMAEKSELIRERKQSLVIRNHQTKEQMEREYSDKNTGSQVHHMRHHGHRKSEVETLQRNMGKIEKQNEAMLQEVQNFKENQNIMQIRINALEISTTKLTSKNNNVAAEQSAMWRQMKSIQGQIEVTERQSREIRSAVNNITESGIKKLHASTVQLFETLETLESNYDRAISDLRKEVSKMEFGLAQAQSAVGELREDQGYQDQRLKTTKNDLRKLQMETKADRFRILEIQSDVINKTLQDVKFKSSEAAHELTIGSLEKRISSLSATIDGERQEMDVLKKIMGEKAELSELNKWQRAQDRLREIVLNVTDVIPKLSKDEQIMEDQMKKIILQLPKDCSQDSRMELSLTKKSGVILIQSPILISTSQPKAIQVFCDMDNSGGNWMLIQRRQDGDMNFNQNWHHYKEGFGDVRGDFWLGNEIIHQLTTSNDYALHIDLWDAAGRYKYAEYSTFRVLQESDGYRLAVAGYQGNASDSLGYHNGMAFSTPDRDNDASLATHCGQFYGSGWWYNHCQYVNINGRYSTGVTWYDIDGQEWSELTRVEMKIKPLRLLHKGSSHLITNKE